jgi:raffinose/stachyose/melibiose transport system permease protein
MSIVSRPRSAVAVGTAEQGLSNTGLRRQKLLIVVAFLLPPGLIYTWLVVLPVIQAIYYSFFKWNGLGPVTDFIGLDNYVRLFNDSVFLRSITNGILLVVLSTAVQLPLAMGLALLIRRRLAGRRIFRTIFFLPYVLSEVVTGLIWSFIYNPQTGLINSILGAIIPGFKPVGWLGEPNLVIIALFIVISWKYFGLHLILYMTGLQGIPAELEEAAVVDGASGVQSIRHIIIPQLAPTIRLSIYLSVLGSLQIFDLVWVMTTGGPVNASQTMATYLYKFGFQRFAIGYGSAVAVALFMICFGFSILYQRFVMSRDNDR